MLLVLVSGANSYASDKDLEGVLLRSQQFEPRTFAITKGLAVAS